jgi:hypothetical protein
MHPTHIHKDGSLLTIIGVDPHNPQTHAYYLHQSNAVSHIANIYVRKQNWLDNIKAGDIVQYRTPLNTWCVARFFRVTNGGLIMVSCEADYINAAQHMYLKQDEVRPHA